MPQKPPTPVPPGKVTHDPGAAGSFWLTLPKYRHAAPVRNRQPPCRAALTLVELLVVIGIILLLTAIALPAVGAIRNAARQAQATGQVQALTAGCEVYALEDRQRRPPPAETDLALRTGLRAELPARNLDLLEERGIRYENAQLAEADPRGRVLLDPWRRPLRYQPDTDMDGTADKPAPQEDWNAKDAEPYPYLWSLGRPVDDGDAAPAAAGRWIYVRTTK